ncbi:hypothetical protein GH714_025319 [Hevea brasiliensis]|uniref:Myb-like domain-containing protein n=1 Tax=Hevea brasiliensis TaxID=3981 RepID=A0A6A6LB67_HEVBR|nr:hypothetical protein GH714_025319 [Hevea brasiliensis]
MQGDSNTVPATSGVVDVATATMVHEDGEVGGGGGGAPNSSGEEDKSIIRVDEGDRMSYGANRWPRQETLALLKIRSDMDAVFRDSSLKGPLWEEVSRKLAELGYHRSAKKCKEKFENVYKYHKRTKEADPAINAMPLSSSQPLNPSQNIFPSFQNLTSHLFSSSTSSSTASDEGYQTTPKRKRSKWKDFLERLTKDVMRKQEELQRKFLETVEKREHERMAREEAWRMQEMARINREHEILIQERTTAAAKDAAVIAFLQKISGQQNSIQTDNGQNNAVVSSSSRWPKVEVQALINLRTNLDTKYQENGPKGPLWEEISAGMQKLGYNRSAKRCKEKWENINKYFKKVKETARIGLKTQKHVHTSTNSMFYTRKRARLMRVRPTMEIMLQFIP